jgi:hypothetical protein
MIEAVKVQDGQARSNHLELDPETFRANFNRCPFTVKHHLAHHPLFNLKRLVALAHSLPEEHVKYNSGVVPLTQGLYRGPQTGLSIEETLYQLEECNSWMVIKWIEKDPAYRELLDQCLDQIQELSEPFDPGMCKREGFIFVSSPGAITPYHMDPEYNFLLQIRGHKRLHFFDGSDRSILSEQELEEYMESGSNYDLKYDSKYKERLNVALTPGVAVHVPVTTPHWVENGNEVSISLSITFRTKASERRSIVYEVNSRLRRMGLAPRPFNRSPLLDTAKYQTFRVVRRTKRLLGRTPPEETSRPY